MKHLEGLRAEGRLFGTGGASPFPGGRKKSVSKIETLF